MKTKFTPGPWTVDGPPHNQIVWSSPEDRVCFLAHSDGRDEERDIATGNLIAAAPDLCSIVARLVAMPGGAWHPDRHAAEEAELMADARSALLKASGGEA